MSPDTVLRAAASHLYPGARGRVAGPLPAAAACPCLVEFSDGSAALGSLDTDRDAPLLATGPYVTAAGTRIPAKRWRIAVEGERFRVLRRA